MTATTNALTEMYSKFEASVIYDKAHMEQVTAAINVLEKKKIKYKIIPMPVYGEEGLEVTFAVIIVIDKKNVKRNKKSISNNKYILFNSWYTKNRDPAWPNSHTMWNMMKQQSSAKPFIDIFDFMEKIGKSIEPAAKKENDAAASTTTDNNNNNERRVKLFNEFYRIATITLTNGNAPMSSFIYDIKLIDKDENINFEYLTPNILQAGIEAFKSIVYNKPSSSSSTTTTTITTTTSKQHKQKESSTTESSTKESKKRKHQQQATKPNKKAKLRQTQSPVISMESDQTDDTQMSFT